MNYKIWQYTNKPLEEWEESPSGLNYKTLDHIKLHPKLTFVKGELLLAEYFAEVSLELDGSKTYSDPILKVDFIYQRDPTTGLIFRQERVLSWYFENDALSEDTKVVEKFYDPKQAIEEGKRRRTNVLDDIALKVIGLVAATEGISQDAAIDLGSQFQQDYLMELDSYVKSPREKKFEDRLTAETAYSWLNNDISALTGVPGLTVRLYLLNELVAP